MLLIRVILLGELQESGLLQPGDRYLFVIGDAPQKLYLPQQLILLFLEGDLLRGYLNIKMALIKALFGGYVYLLKGELEDIKGIINRHP